MEPDPGLINRARRGDVQAFEALLRPLISPACQLAFTFLHDWPEAEDAVQDACLKSWRGLARLQGDPPGLRPWYFTIVANTARSRRRRRWWAVVRMPEVPSSAATSSAADNSLLRVDLDRAMRRLSDTDRRILALHFYLDLPLEEVGSILGLSAEAVKSRMYRATRSLRPAMTVQEVGS